MKNIFDYNTVDDRYDGQQFFGKRISPELEAKMDANVESADRVTKKAIPYLIAEGLVAMICPAALYLLINSGVMGKFPAVIIVLLFAGVFYLIRKKKVDDLECELSEKCVARADALWSAARHELEIPERRFEVEVIYEPYEKVKEYRYPEHKGYYDNTVMEVYQKGECLCFFTSVNEVMFPFDKITAIDLQRKNRVLDEWYKEENCKKFSVRETGDGRYKIREYYRILIDSEGESYEIDIPGYEKDAVKRIFDMIEPYKR